MNLKDAMQSAKDSYRADIDAGFHMLHIDTSIDIHSQPNADQILERVYELYDFVGLMLNKKDKILFLRLVPKSRVAVTTQRKN